MIIKDGKLVWYRPEAKDTGLKCPKCGKSIMDNGKAFECQGKKDNTCTFSVWKEPGGKPFSMKDLKDLLEKKKTTLKKGLKGKSGKTFDAYIILKPDFTTGYEFDNSKKNPKK